MSNASPIQPLPIQPGTILAGKYRVERILGQGGMGVVVEARHIALDERVALKFLLPEVSQNHELKERFGREARAAVKIKSEHVARVSDVGTLETGAPYMVMEFLEGRDLSKLLETEGVLHYPDAVDYLIQGCEAIAEAHGYGIVHRDIKPANLFLAKRPDGSPIVKVLDFGISKDTRQGVDNLTRTTTAMGSALYMSPEQMTQTKNVDHRTDIYALGISLYELLAGRQPFYADTLPALCGEVLTGIPTPLRSVRPDIPEGLAAVIEKAYARDRNNRFQSVAELVIALAPYALPRSQTEVERMARMAGLAPPPAGSAGRISNPNVQVPQTGYQTGPQPPQAAYQTGPQAPQAAYQTGPQAPQAAYQTGPQPSQHGGTQIIPEGQPQQQYPAQGGTVALQAMDPAASPGPPPAPPPPGGNQIVPGHYSGPMSVRAAASFAQGATTNAALTTTGKQPSGGRTGMIAVAVIALLAGGGLGAVWWFNGKKVATPAGGGITTSTATTQPVESAAPVVTATATAVVTATASAPTQPAADTSGSAHVEAPAPGGSVKVHNTPHGGAKTAAPANPAPTTAPATQQGKKTDPLDHM